MPIAVLILSVLYSKTTVIPYTITSVSVNFPTERERERETRHVRNSVTIYSDELVLSFMIKSC